MQETLVWFLGGKDPLEKGSATHSSILGFPCGLAHKETACNAGDPGLIPGWRSSPVEGIAYPLQYFPPSLVAQSVKNPPAVRTWFYACVGKIPWRRAWQSTPVFLLGESPWTEKPDRLQFTQRVEHDWVTKHTHSKKDRLIMVQYILWYIVRLSWYFV